MSRMFEIRMTEEDAMLLREFASAACRDGFGTFNQRKQIAVLCENTLLHAVWEEPQWRLIYRRRQKDGTFGPLSMQNRSAPTAEEACTKLREDILGSVPGATVDDLFIVWSAK